MPGTNDEVSDVKSLLLCYTTRLAPFRYMQTLYRMMRCLMSKETPLLHNTHESFATFAVWFPLDISGHLILTKKESKLEVIPQNTLLLHLLVNHRLAFWGKSVLVKCRPVSLQGLPQLAREPQLPPQKQSPQSPLLLIVPAEAGRFASLALTT